MKCTLIKLLSKTANSESFIVNGIINGIFKVASNGTMPGPESV